MICVLPRVARMRAMRNADLLGEERIQVGGGLVVQDQLRIGGKRTGDGRALAHAARQIAGKLALAARELDLREGVVHALANLAGGTCWCSRSRSATFSATVSDASSAEPWNTMAMRNGFRSGGSAR